MNDTTPAESRVLLDGIEALMDNILNYSVTPWDNPEAVEGRDGYMSTLDRLRGSLSLSTMRYPAGPACPDCGGDATWSFVTRTGYCVGCASDACEQGEGDRVGLPVPDDMDRAVEAVERHMRECTAADRGMCPVCTFGSATCPECDQRSKEMIADDVAAHMMCGPLVTVGCEGYAMPIVRAAWIELTDPR